MKNKLIYIIFAILICIIVIIIAILNSYKNEQDKNDISYVLESGEEYNSENLNNFDFKIVTISEEILKNIKNIDTLSYYMKEYLYKNGIVEANKAEYIAYSLNNNIMIIKFKLNDQKQTRVIAKIDLQKDLYEFVNY